MKKTLFADIIGLIGLGSMFYGLWRIYPPAAFVVIGGILFCLALWSLSR